MASSFVKFASDLRAIAIQFDGSLDQVEHIKSLFPNQEITWAPVKYNDPFAEDLDLSEGVELDVMTPFGLQSAVKGDWLIRDEVTVRMWVCPAEYFQGYFEEAKIGE